MHCSCCGSSSWRPNGWRFPAASWTISAGTPGPLGLLARFPFFFLPSESTTAVASVSLSPRPHPCPRFPVPPLLPFPGRPFFSDTTPLVPPQPSCCSRPLHPSSRSPGASFLLCLVTQVFSFSVSGATSRKQGPRVFQRPPPPPVAFSASLTRTGRLPLLPPPHFPSMWKAFKVFNLRIPRPQTYAGSSLQTYPFPRGIFL